MAICNVSLAICEFLRWAALKNALSYYSPGYVCLYKPTCLPLRLTSRAARTYVLISAAIRSARCTPSACMHCIKSQKQAHARS